MSWLRDSAPRAFFCVLGTVLLISFSLFLLSNRGSPFQPTLQGVSQLKNAFYYNGRYYTYHIFYGRRDTRTQIGKSDDGDPVYTYDGSENFLEVQGSDNTGCYIAEGCAVPSSGEVTGVLVDPGIRGGKNIFVDSEEELDLLSQLTALDGAPEQYTLEHYSLYSNSLYYIYDNCNISCSENFAGALTYVEEQWVFVPHEFHQDFLWLDSSTAEIHGIPVTDAELVERLAASDFTRGIRLNPF